MALHQTIETHDQAIEDVRWGWANAGGLLDRLSGGHAVSGILLTVFGYFAMVLAA